MSTFKKWIRNTHLWLGLSCGLIASISGLTGSLYIWQPELTALLNPELLTTNKTTPITEVYLYKTANALVEKHGDSLAKVNFPYRTQETIALVFDNDVTRYYNPLTGAYLGEKSDSIKFFESLRRFHRNLLIPVIGKYIMGTSTVLFFLLLLSSGAYLWYRTYSKKWRKGFKIKWKAKKRKLNYDLHKAPGIIFLIPLMIIAFTGAYFTFGTYYRTAFTVFDATETPALAEPGQRIGDTITYEGAFPDPGKGYDLRSLIFLNDAEKGYRFRYIKDRFLMSGLRKTKELRLDTEHTITRYTDYETTVNSNKIAAQFYPIHIGEIAGIWGRILVFISGFIPVILFVTGLRFYLFRKKMLK